MNKPIDPRDLQPFRVTTGPLPASQKLYSPAPGFPDVLVPFREISVHPTAKEPPIRAPSSGGRAGGALAKESMIGLWQSRRHSSRYR